jgi:hypothetical protein
MKMKTIKFLCAVILMTAFASCDNDDDSATVTEDDAAEMIAASLSESSSGLTSVIEVSAEGSNVAVDNSGGRVAACGYTYSESFTKTSLQGSSITYNYDFSYGYALTCSADAPLSLAIAVTFDGEFDGPRLSSNHTGTADLDFTALDKDLTAFIANGTYSQSGSFESKVRNLNSGSSDDVNVDKANYEIESGTASVVITGNVTGKAAFSFEASVTFTGDKTGTITINGSTYAVNLLTGEVTKQ